MSSRATWFRSLSIFAVVLTGTVSGQGQDAAAARPDTIVEDVPGHPELVKVIHICRDAASRGAKGSVGSAAALPEHCDNDGAGFSLLSYSWPSGTTATSFTLYSLDSGVSADALQTAMVNSFAIWGQVDSSGIPAIQAGDTDTKHPPAVSLLSPVDPLTKPVGVGSATNGVQTIHWDKLEAGTLAVTWTWYNRFTKKIIEVDVVFNTDYSWASFASESCDSVSTDLFDVQNVMTHEAGHVFGLGHSSRDGELTMYPYSSPGETLRRSPSKGDVQGIQKKY